MEKSIARAKYAGSRRGRRRFSSHARRSTSFSSSFSASSPLADDVWDDYQDVLPLEEIDEEDNSGKPKSKSQGLDYGEILAQNPFYKYTAPRGLDPLEDAFADLYSFEDSEASSSATFLSLDLEKLAEHLSGMSLSKRLFLEDETLPSELLRAGDETKPPENSEAEETMLSENSEAETQQPAATSQSVEDEMEVVEEEEVAVEEWLKVALQDPQDGKAVKFDKDASEQDEAARFKTQDQAEKELESLLKMLDRITVEGNNSSSSKAGKDGVEAVTNLEAPVMSQKDLESLFWSPESPKSADRPKVSSPESPKSADRPKVSSPNRSTEEEETKNLPPSDEDDFDAWLDSLDK